MQLKDKVAVVTGGGSGIGRGVCLAYAREGADVVVVDINKRGAAETVAGVEVAGRRGIAVETDVADPAQVNAMVAAALKAFKHIDVLFNGAGILFPTSILDTTVEQWDRTLNVNLRGHFLCLQAVGRGMVEQGSGKIINISSVLGIQGRAQRAAYGVSKAGIIMLTKTAAMEFGPHGVCVNAIAPGSIETPFATTAPATPEENKRKMAVIPLRRRGTPDDLTGPAVFLASSASDYVSGAVLTVDGAYIAGIQ